MTGKDMAKVEKWFDLEVDSRHRVGATTTRHASHHHALRPQTYKYEDKGNFFSNRVVQDSLPEHVSQATDINSLKNNLDKHRGTPCRTASRPTDNRWDNRNMNRGPS